MSSAKISPADLFSRTMNERDIIRRLQKHSKFIGDDCAILPNGKEDMLVTTDQFIEKVHFLRETHRAPDIGWNALARGLSDIAAMGGTPRYAFVSLALPEWACQHFLNDFYKGFLQLAKKHNTELGGGDLSHADQFFCDVMVLGATPRGKAFRRDGAKPGDFIYVSGPLGKAKKRFEPRIETGLSLRGKVSACMDISDGISLDLARLCEASGMGADLAEIPVAKGASLEDALHRGEDYELLFTSQRKLDYFCIGQIVSRKGVRLNGQPLEAKGYDHFSFTRKDT